MQGDLKEVVGALMRALSGAPILRAEVRDLSFEALGELEVALNRAYLTLLEYAYDCEADIKPDDEMKNALHIALAEIVRCADSHHAGN